jgi:predicted nucleic acid-binding protein
LSRWVVDTAPLIFLAKLDRLDLLRTGARDVVIPPAVRAEVAAHDDAAERAIAAATAVWLRVHSVTSHTAVGLLQADLDLGEAEAIVLAREISADRLVLDDLDARRLARRVGLPIVGTVGLLLAARLRGEISDLTAELERLLQLGFRVDQRLLDEVLAAAGERRPLQD